MINRKKYALLFTIGFIFLLTSCVNFWSSNTKPKNYEITGTVFTQILPSADRAAFPSDDGSFYFTITATCGSDTVTAESSTIDPSFTLKLSKVGEWNVSASGYEDEAKTKKRLETKSDKILIINDENPSGKVDLVLKPREMSTGFTGDVNLTIKYNGTIRPIDYVEVKFLSENLQTERFHFTKGTNQTTITGSPLSASYILDISFYDSSSKTNLYYNATEVINIYPGLETNTWVKFGNEEYLVDDGSGNIEFLVTDELTESFLLDTIYVDGTNGDDTSAGGWIKPFKTFDRAISYFTSHDNVKKIFICDDTVECSDVLVLNNRELAIKKAPFAETAKITMDLSSGNFVDVSNTSGSLTICDVELESAGAGIASAIYVHDDGSTPGTGGTLNLINTTISNCKLQNSNHKVAEEPDIFNYGAVYIESGTLTLCGENHITGNTFLSTGADPDTEKEENIYLDSVIIKILGDISGSQIGISTDSDDDLGNFDENHQFIFTQDYSVYNSESPDNYFTSDYGYATGWNAAKEEACMAFSLYNPTVLIHEDYEIRCLKNKIINPDVCGDSGRKVQFYLYNNSTGEDLTSRAEWKIIPKYMGLDASASSYDGKFCTKSGNSVTFTNQIGLGTLDIVAIATVNGDTVGTSHCVEIVEMETVEDFGDEVPVAGTSLALGTVDGMNQLREWIKDENTLIGVSIVLQSDIVLDDFETIKPTSTDYTKQPAFTLNGNGSTITINSFANGSSSMFDDLKNSSSVSNVIFEGNIEINTSSSVVVLAQFAPQKVENCINRVNITAPNGSATGLFYQAQLSGNLINCRNEGNITAKNNVAGLLLNSNAMNGLKFQNCVNTGNLTSSNNSAAGIVTWGKGSGFINCINTGNIKGKDKVGGIAGYQFYYKNEGRKIQNCKNSGEVSGTGNYVGGIVGFLGYETSQDYITGYFIENNVSTGVVKYVGTETVPATIGQIIGYVENQDNYTNKVISNNFYLKHNDSPFYGIGGTVTDVSSQICAFTVEGSSSVTEVPLQITGSALYSSDVVYLLNKWIENQATPSNYVKWVYGEDGLPKLSSEE